MEITSLAPMGYQTLLKPLDGRIESLTQPHTPFLKMTSNFHLRDLIRICGFKSFQDLTNWFNWTELQTLKELGFVIAEYETKEVYVGSKQLVFIPEGERTITPISVYNYYKS
jgi:hypothetical protein